LAFLGVGIYTLYNSTGAGMEKAKSMLLDWIKGILILFFIPYVMKYILDLNDALINLLINNKASFLEQGTSFDDGSKWSVRALDFRSPKYVSRRTGYVQYASSEYNESYASELTTYENNFDLMRIMRAYTGVTYSLGYCFLWYVCIAQLLTFIFIYIKRFFMIALLIAIFPVTCIFNAISILRGQKGMQMNTWIKEFVTNVFTQFIHAVVYSIITGVCVDLIRTMLKGNTSSATMNWLVMLVAINFIPAGEKILKNLLSALASGSSSTGIAEGAKGIKGAVKERSWACKIVVPRIIV
jgi:hypothetical protein